MVGACAPYETQSAVGHGDGFARPTLSARYRFSQETFARTSGQQLVRGQIARLTPVEDRLGDVRGEIAEADEPREVGRAHTLPLGQCGKRQAVAADECGVEAARPDQRR